MLENRLSFYRCFGYLHFTILLISPATNIIFFDERILDVKRQMILYIIQMKNKKG